MKMDPTQHRSSVSGPLGAGGIPHSYEFHTKRKMFDKGPEVCQEFINVTMLITIVSRLVYSTKTGQTSFSSHKKKMPKDFRIGV